METARALDVDLQELEDWNCCGATAYFHCDELLAYTLVARNLAMAEATGLDLVAPCSGCFKNAYFTRKALRSDPELAEHINIALQEDNLQVTGSSQVRHLLEVYFEDVGLPAITERVTRPLKGLRVAPYYGCQLVRPRKDHEEIENPQYFEELLEAVGATAVDYPAKTRCCGGSLIISNRQAALDMVYTLLQNAADHEADVIATICPLCQVNLEVYQKQVNREYGTYFSIAGGVLHPAGWAGLRHRARAAGNREGAGLPQAGPGRRR